MTCGTSPPPARKRRRDEQHERTSSFVFLVRSVGWGGGGRDDAESREDTGGDPDSGLRTFSSVGFSVRPPASFLLSSFSFDLPVVERASERASARWRGAHASSVWHTHTHTHTTHPTWRSDRRSLFLTHGDDGDGTPHAVASLVGDHRRRRLVSFDCTRPVERVERATAAAAQCVAVCGTRGRWTPPPCCGERSLSFGLPTARSRRGVTVAASWWRAQQRGGGGSFDRRRRLALPRELGRAVAEPRDVLLHRGDVLLLGVVLLELLRQRVVARLRTRAHGRRGCCEAPREEDRTRSPLHTGPSHGPVTHGPFPDLDEHVVVAAVLHELAVRVVEVDDVRADVVEEVLRAQCSAMEWNGMEWNGMEWNGMEWNGME